MRVVGVPHSGVSLDDGVCDLEGGAERVLDPRGVHANAVPVPGRAPRLVERYPPLHLCTALGLDSSILLPRPRSWHTLAFCIIANGPYSSRIDYLTNATMLTLLAVLLYIIKQR